MTSSNHRLIALLVAVLALTAGCTGAGTGGDAGDAEFAGGSEDFDAEPQAATVALEAEATATPMATPAEGGDGGDGGQPAGDYNAQRFAERQLILTGHVAVEVEDFETARRNLTEATASYGGFVSDTRQQVHRIDNESWTEGMIVLRVPRDNFTALYERARAEGELIEANRESRDVTDQLVDLQARLENLKAERDQLRQLYERANSTEDVLEVQERLSEVQGEIERLEARQQSLRERVALSTITVRINEPRPEPDRPVPDRWYDIPLVAAFLDSVNGVVVTLRAIAVGAAYAAPYLVVFGLPLAALGYVVRRRGGRRSPGQVRQWIARRRSSEPTDAEASEPAEDGEDER